LVLTSELVKLQKKLKLDDALAKQLWKSGNAEARILALLIRDPAKLSVTAKIVDGFVDLNESSKRLFATPEQGPNR
jgi:hypothetical protein